MRTLMRAVPFLLLAGTATAAAQERAAAPEAARPQPPPAAAPPAPTPAAPRPEPSLTNIRIDLTLTDQSGARPAVKKTIALTLADGERGAVRSRPHVAVPMAPGASQKTFHALPLNVDARPLLIGQKINLFLTIEYSSIDQQPSAGETPRVDVNFSGHVLLDSGRPMVVAEAADPVSDRRVTVEVKATILK